MLENFIKNRIINALPFSPNEGQGELLHLLTQFILSKKEQKAFVLRGYAGTGKTSIMAAVVKALGELKQPVVLLAPTGRAAKVLARYANKPAYTIHKYIYRQDKLGADSFSLSDNLHKHTLFIIDEASMIDIMLMNSLLKAIKLGTRVIIVGDVDVDKTLDLIEENINKYTIISNVFGKSTLNFFDNSCFILNSPFENIVS